MYGQQSAQLTADGTEDPIPEGITDGVLKAIYEGVHEKDELSGDLYRKTADKLLSAYKKGYEKEYFGADWTRADNNLLTCVQNNLFAFSAAKSYAEVVELRDLVYRDGKLTPWADYRRAALKVDRNYNLHYLEAERQAVVAAGTQGSRWIDVQRDKQTHPYLEYVTARDSHVREEHRALEGIILPVDDPFWQNYYPPNGWRCRCTTASLSERTAEHKKTGYQSRHKSPMPDSETAQKAAGKSTPKQWRHNVGTSEVFERDGHPYFKASKAARELQLTATKNYGMKSTKAIYTNPSKLSAYRGGIQNKDDYAAYWAKMEGKGEGYTLIDRKNDVSAHFDRALRDKMIDRGRYTYFDEAERVFNDPHEVWGVFKNGGNHQEEEFFNAYIRYYEDAPMVLLVNKDGRVDSFYRWERGVDNFEDFRAGVLKYKR